MRKAFTLIELLMVIAIIALLVGIILPCLGKARASARQAVCFANQHEISQCVQMYMDDNKCVPFSQQNPAHSPMPDWGCPLETWTCPEMARSAPGTHFYYVPGWLLTHNGNIAWSNPDPALLRSVTRQYELYERLWLVDEPLPVHHGQRIRTRLDGFQQLGPVTPPVLP